MTSHQHNVAAITLDPFAIWSAFPTSDYYESSAPPRRHQLTTDLPTGQLAATGFGTTGMIPTFTFRPFDRVGTQLCPCRIAAATPQTFTTVSRPATSPRQGVPCDNMPRVRAATQPKSARLELVDISKRAFGRRLLTYTSPSRLPDPDHLAVLVRPGVVRAAYCPHSRPGDQVALSFSRPAATSRTRCPFITARSKGASWRSMSEVHTQSNSPVATRGRSGPPGWAVPGLRWW